MDLATTVRTGTERALAGSYDALILDVVLPDGSGYDLLRVLREAACSTPALFLSARAEVADRVRGLRLGADDYLPKPFALEELAARLDAICRRASEESRPARLKVADLSFDPMSGSVHRGQRRIDLTPKQLALLDLLMRNAGRVVSRETILERVWNEEAELRSNAVTVQVCYLRRRIDEGFEPKLIHTKPGLGYVLEARIDAGAA